MGSFRSSGLNMGVPPCKSISLQGTRSKFHLACYCTVAYAEGLVGAFTSNLHRPSGKPFMKYGYLAIPGCITMLPVQQSTPLRRFKESTLTGLPAQSVGSSNKDECWTGLHEMAMAAFESQYMDKDTYSAPAEDIEVQSCFLDDQLTNLSPPRNCMPPDVLFCESRQPT
ncbi:hypothetical protein Tco_0251791 [Tanacetum coccineum]